jgi:hypothetical protein
MSCPIRQEKSLDKISPDLCLAPSLLALAGIITRLSAGLSTGIVDSMFHARNLCDAAWCGAHSTTCLPTSICQAQTLVKKSPNLRRAPSLQARMTFITCLSAGLSTGVVDSADGLAKESPSTRYALPLLGRSFLSTALPQWFSTTAVETASATMRGFASATGPRPFNLQPCPPINARSPSR